MSVGGGALQVLGEALERSIEDVAKALPDLLLAVAVAVIFFVVGLVLVRLIRKFLMILRIEEMVRPYIKYGIPVNTIITALVAVGLALLAIHVIALILCPEAIGIVESTSRYVGRIVSVAFLVIFTFMVIDAVVERIRMERGLRGFMTLLTFLITTILIIDITSLSTEVKQALAWGLSLGIGLSIGVFTAWYFFSPQHRASEKRGGGEP